MTILAEGGELKNTTAEIQHVGNISQLYRHRVVFGWSIQTEVKPPLDQVSSPIGGD